MQVFNFGSVNIDIVYRVPHLVAAGETLSSTSMNTVLGGKGANQSVALARAGCNVRHVGKLSRKDSWAREQLAQAGVDVSAVTLIDDASGHAIIQVDDAGENSIILHGGANQTFTGDELAKELAQASVGDWLLMQNECNGLNEAFSLAQSHQLRIVFNPAPMTKDMMNLPLERCEVIIVNETEAASLAGVDDLNAALVVLGKRYPDTRLVLTLGSKGALMYKDGRQVKAEAFSVTAVDTTGAGDTFVGYYLAALMQGHDDEKSLGQACAAAALSVTKQGATPSIPAAAEVAAFFKTGQKPVR